MQAIGRGNGIPLYVQVRDQLRDQLAELAPGTMIPAEQELEQRFRVSRITIRKAIHELVAEGLLSRHQGRGTFVEAPKITHELNTITSRTEQLIALGYTPRTSHLKIERVPAPKRVMQALEIPQGEELLALRRVRLTDNETISLMANYLVAKLVPDFETRVGDFESLYEYSRKNTG